MSGLERCILTYRAQIRTIDSLGRVYLEMWCRVPGRGEFSSRGLQHAVTGGSEWAACETPCFLKAGERPDLIKLNLVCAGTVLIKGIELLHTAAQVEAPVPPVCAANSATVIERGGMACGLGDRP